MRKTQKFALLSLLSIGSINFILPEISAQQVDNKDSDKMVVSSASETDSTQVTVSGRVSNLSGKGISNVRIAVVVNGATLYGKTNPFGYYRVKGIEAGSTAIFQLRHKRYTFASQVLNVLEDLPDTNFTSQQ